MLFRFTIALFVLFNTLPAPSLAAGKGTAGGSEVTVVGPTDDTAAFIAVRPVTTLMQPEVSPVQMTTTATVPQPAAEEPQIQQDMHEMTAGRGEMTTGMAASEMQPRVMERMRGRRMRGRRMRGRRMRGRRMRGRRLYRRSGTQAQPTGTMEMPRVTTPVVSTPETPRQEPNMEQPTMERPMMEQSTMEQPTMEQPMTTPETEQVTPAASEMSVRGARFNTAVGEIEINNAMLGREGERTVPGVALRDVDFNTFVGRLRAQRTELGRGEEPQWERVWMPRRRFEWPRRRFAREFAY